jgi:hypothetical protein
VPDVNTPPDISGPSPRALLRSTIVAGATALLILVTVVLPAEYGIDPTRIGRVLGLTRMGEIKTRLAREAAADEAADRAAQEAEASAPPNGSSDSVRQTPPEP